MKLSYNIFIVVFLLVLILGLGPVAAFNYYIDPLWTFSHAHDLNDVQVVIDERQQKMNEIHYQEFDFDTLLIGSSRSTYVNPHKFEGMDVYNFSASDLSFMEYKDMIDFAKEEKGNDFERIILGVDFFKSSKEQSANPPTLDEYRENIEDPFYRWKNLISLDVLDYAKKNHRLSEADNVAVSRVYDRDNTARAKVFQKETIMKETEAKIQKFRDEFYGESYTYNPEFKNVLAQLQRENPNTEFILYTTPISAALFEAMMEEGNLEDYYRWLNDMIDVFGGVHHFMYPNSVTEDLGNYFDGHHFYPNVGDMIAARISMDNPPDVPDDFGVYVTEPVGGDDWKTFGK